MNAEVTKLEWKYQPTDFFEACYARSAEEYDLAIEAGNAVATLRVPQDPVSPDFERRIRDALSAVFAVRQLQTHRPFTLHDRPAVLQHEGDKVAVTIHCLTERGVGRDTMDLVKRDAAGNVVYDSKAERIAHDESLLDSVAPKLLQSDTLKPLVASYCEAVSDPANELVYLYEVRDHLAKHYGSETKAQQSLGTTKKDWQRLGILANVEPLAQGRHRGKHVFGRRHATDAELEEARGIVRRWILAFAETV